MNILDELDGLLAAARSEVEAKLAEQRPYQVRSASGAVLYPTTARDRAMVADAIRLTKRNQQQEEPCTTASTEKKTSAHSPGRTTTA